MGCWVVFHDVEFTTALLCKVCAPFPVTEMVNPLAAFQFSPADFYPQFSLPFLPPILQEIFPPIFTPDFAGDFPRVFFTRHFPPAFSPGIFPRLSGGRFSPPIFPVQNFHPLYRHGPDSHPPLNESAKNRTFTISAKSVMLRTQIPSPQKSSPSSPKPHPQISLSPKGDIGSFGDE